MTECCGKKSSPRMLYIRDGEVGSMSNRYLVEAKLKLQGGRMGKEEEGIRAGELGKQEEI